ncbi:uncharacterized protein T551_01193 [Pneumocystis jirovecii RU7]|uniref:Thioredoxin domain-containing protein n=1 Tax=Pneumocystis jirovecii (strain RU7) TaxID=1408657 RepID=A0A0W4ZRW3_PNEJ7|nr:uncharacterized protein T551_01193 [Pneumocystis jirovecii RU7]KTW31120.1 hypothetical protein T551_01193 [Pneumocystis jirovecii RU7]
MKITLEKIFLILCFFSHVFSTQVIIQDFLKERKANNGIIQLNSKSINSVITKPRNYTMVIMFTTTEEQYNCNLCKKLEPIFKLVAKSQHKTYPKSEELFFGILEFSDGPEVFEKLQLTAVPVIMLYPATIGPNASRKNTPYILNIKSGDISSNWLAQIISQETKQPIRIIQFINYGKVFFYAFITFLSVVFLRLIRSFVFFIITKKELWLILSLASILIFNSGYMFTRIRNISFNGYDNDIPIYILETFNSQYGIESLIISTTCKKF